MPLPHDVIVIGGSAGAVEGLLRLVPGLPAGLAARVFITIHLPPSVSALPAILSRAGHLPACHPADGEPTAPGTIYVAPPDHHLLVRAGHARVVRGPPENGHRPAIDPLFRSAAASYGPRVACVVLSGNLVDGRAGAAAVHAAGGVVLVQDPAECLYPGMPSAALAAVPSATVLPLDAIAAHLVALSVPARCGEVAWPARRGPDTDPAELEDPGVEGLSFPALADGVPQDSSSASLESALRTALRALEEGAEMAGRLHRRASQHGNARAARAYAHSATTYEQRARVIRDLLRRGVPGGEMASPAWAGGP